MDGIQECLILQIPHDTAVDGKISSVLEMKELPAVKKQKVPKRILHFSDGVIEEFSTDEEDEDEVDKQPEVDPVCTILM